MTSDMSKPAERRRKRYIDHALQGRLLGVLLAAQFALIGIVLMLLYGELDEALKQNLYRIHQVKHQSLGTIVMPYVTGGIVALCLLSALGFVAVELLWRRQAQRLVRDWDSITSQVRELDFRTATTAVRGHESLCVLDAWRRVEGERLARIADLANRLPAQPPANREERARLRELVGQIRDQLPQESPDR